MLQAQGPQASKSVTVIKDAPGLYSYSLHGPGCEASGPGIDRREALMDPPKILIKN